MGYRFWVIRTLKVYIGVLIALLVIELLKHHSIENALIFAATWSFISTSLFIGTRLYQSRKGVECLLCNDIANSKEKVG
jgi:hypothetical protein